MEEKLYANRIGYSDVDPYEIIEKKTDKLYVIREMEAVETEESKRKRIKSFIPGGFFGHFDNDIQEWDIKPKKDGWTLKIRRHKDGYFYDTMGQRYSLSNKPVKFYDFNF